ncbi:MAG: hypothetical protein ABI629_14810 [bacterium]
MWLLKYRNWEPPPWAVDKVSEGRNSQVVRLDDLGDATSTSFGHGFHIVDVRKRADAPDGKEVKLYWIRL